MRYVDIDLLKLPKGWKERAVKAAKAVADGEDPDDHSKVWTDLKGQLSELFPEKKCWFCETMVDRADNAVDHFRPKKRVADASLPHSGYRWLAFEPSNFRYACTFCNSRRKGVDTAGGKADRFPLSDETVRRYKKGDTGIETPVLLDPCDLDDWRLLGCQQEDGQPCPATTVPGEVTRVEQSIGIYHLDYGPTVTRRHTLAVNFIGQIDLAKDLFPGSLSDMSQRTLFQKSAKLIRRAIQRNADFSGEMIFLLKAERHSEHPWIDNLLEGA